MLSDQINFNINLVRSKEFQHKSCQIKTTLTLNLSDQNNFNINVVRSN